MRFTTWLSLLLVTLGTCAVVAFTVQVLRKDREAATAELAAKHLEQVEEASRRIAESLGDIGENLHLASELVANSSGNEDITRQLRPILEAVPPYRAIAVVRDPDSPALTMADRKAPEPVLRGDFNAELETAARDAARSSESGLIVSTTLAKDPTGMLRIFALRSTSTRLGLAVLAETSSFFSPLRVAASGSGMRMFVMGPRGNVLTGIEPPLATMLNDPGRRQQLPALASALSAMRQSAGSAVLSEAEASLLGMPEGAVTVWSPISVQGSLPWAVGMIVPTRDLSAHQRALMFKLTAAALAIVGFLGAFAAWIAVAGRRAVALRESERHARALEKLHARTQKILDGIPTVVIALDANKHVATANEAARAHEPAVLPGVSLRDAFPQAESESLLRLTGLLDDGITSGAVRSLHAQPLALYGEAGSFTAHAVPLPDGGEIRALLVIEDLSEVRDLEAQLVRAEKLATLGVLAAGVAHEVGTPLGIIRGRAEYLRGKLGNDHPQASGLNVIVEQIERVTRTFEQLLDFSRVKRPVAQPVELRPAALMVQELLRGELRRRKIELSVDGAAGCWVQADPDQLQQVLLNLVLNAAQACAEAGRIRLSFAKEPGEGCLIEVMDDGCGIPRENLHRVFDPFFTTKKRGQGTGLGLTIVAQIVRDHGGRLELSSEPELGTRVALHWPAAKTNEANADVG